jgi:hypothetical protein
VSAHIAQDSREMNVAQQRLENCGASRFVNWRRINPTVFD